MSRSHSLPEAGWEKLHPDPVQNHGGKIIRRGKKIKDVGVGSRMTAALPVGEGLLAGVPIGAAPAMPPTMLMLLPEALEFLILLGRQNLLQLRICIGLGQIGRAHV